MARRALVLLVLLAAGWVFAQEESGLSDRARAEVLLRRVASGGSPLSDEEMDLVLAASHTDKVEVDLVMLAAVVVDRKGVPASGLAKEDFRITEDGHTRPVAWFSEDRDRAFRLMIMLDVSGSMGQGMRTAEIRAALLPLMREIRRRDSLRLYSFAGDEVRAESEWNARPFATLDRALRIPRHGRTALVDALVAAADFLPRAPRERQAIVLVSDGMDNASEMTPDQVIAAARTVEVPIYVIALGGMSRAIQSRRSDSPLDVLEKIAIQTGGRYFLVGGETEVEVARKAAQTIRDDLRHQYWLAFRPESPPDGVFHPIDIDIVGRGYSVRSRQGYMRRMK